METINNENKDGDVKTVKKLRTRKIQCHANKSLKSSIKIHTEEDGKVSFQAGRKQKEQLPTQSHSMTHLRGFLMTLKFNQNTLRTYNSIAFAQHI